MSIEEDEATRAARKRVTGFGLHLVGYFLVMAVLVVINLTATTEKVWFVLPMVGWGSVLAIHAAYAMGLFSGLFGGSRMD